MSLLADEIDEIGRRLAQHIGPGSAVARSDRARVRALLREAFQLAQAGRPEAPGEPDETAEGDRALETAAGAEPVAAESAPEPSPEVPLEAQLEMLGRLREAARSLGLEAPGLLEERLAARHKFGAVDQPLVERNANFSTVGLRCAEGWTDVLDARLERTLATLSEIPEESEEGPMVRPIRTQDEARELILSKLD